MTTYAQPEGSSLHLPLEYSSQPDLALKGLTSGDGLPVAVNGKPRYSNWDTEKAVKQGYAASAIIYAATNKIANSLASVPLIVERSDNGTDWELAPDSFAQKLLNKPNPFDTQTTFKKKIAYHLILAGNAVWTKFRDESHGVTKGKPVSLWCLMPQHVNPIRSNQMWCSGYEFKVKGRDPQKIPREDILHWMEINPSDHHWGISRIEVLRKLIQTNNEQLDFQNASVVNRGVISGILHIKNNPTPQQFQKAKKKVENDLEGPRNARRVLITSNKVSWQQIGHSPEELDFLNSRIEGHKEMSIGMGVPLAILGDLQGSTFNNLVETKQIFWENTMIPLGTDVEDGLNCWLMPELSERVRGRRYEYRVRFDWSKVKALQEDLHAKVKSFVMLSKCDVFNPLAINRELDLGFSEDDLKEVITDAEFEVVDDTPPQIAQILERLALPSTQTKMLAEYKAFDDDRRRFERRAKRTLDEVFKTELRLLLDSFDDGDNLEEARAKLIAALNENEENWIEILTAMYESGIDFFARDEYNRGERQLKSLSYNRKAYEGLNNAIRTFINRTVGQRVEAIARTTRERLISLVIDAQSRNLSTGVLREAIRQLYRDEYVNQRSILISETEHATITNRGASYGAEVIAEEEDVRIIGTWITRQDSKVRDSHDTIHGQVRDYGEPFSNGLIEPGDENAPIEETINCRCKLVREYVSN